MSGLDVRPERARAELATLVDAADDDDLVIAYARAAWSAIVEPGDRVAGAIVEAFGPVRALEIALSGDGHSGEESVAGLAPGELAKGCARWRPRRGDIDEALARGRRAGARLVTPEDADWPAPLDDLGPFAPLCLWVRGDPRRLAGAPALSIVGARASTAYGESIAADLGAECAVAGITVVSGAAYGIDGAAHRAALSADGATVAIMAGGIDRAYPVGHIELLEDIAATGAIISEMPCGAAPTKHRFLSRNRVIAALGDATVVVEAGWRSGSQNTAHHAQAIGRPVGVVPGPVTSAASMGCHRLLQEGDAICITGIADVRDYLGVGGAGGVDSVGGVGGAASERTDDRTRVLDALSTRSARVVDDIARRAGLAVDEAAAILGLLALEGNAQRRPTGWVQAKPGAATLW